MVMDGGELISSNASPELLFEVRDLAVEHILNYGFELQNVDSLRSTSLEYLVSMLSENDLKRIVEKLCDEEDDLVAGIETLLILVHNERRNLELDDTLDIEKRETLLKVLCLSIFRLSAFANANQLKLMSDGIIDNQSIVEDFTQLLANTQVNTTLQKASS